MNGRLAGLVAASALAALVGSASCASPGMPPGGPPDTDIPQLLRILPESNAVNVKVPAVVLRFDEVLNERSAPTAGSAAPSGSSGSGGAATGLSALLVLSPSDGRDEVVWRREALELRPRRGFRPNTAYRVTLLPGLADLRNNRISEPLSFVFSTGPSVPEGAVAGVVFDWTTGKQAIGARVELFLPADSTLRWQTRADSSGRFSVSELPEGAYELRAWLDANSDRRISFREVSAVASVNPADTTALELYAYVRDTMPPRLEVVELVDSTGIRLRFDRGLVAEWDGRGATLLGADSVEIALGGPLVPSTVFDSLARQRAARQRAAADSTPADSTADDRPAASDSTAGDSTAAATTRDGPVFRRRVPVTQWTAPLAAPLAPGAYVIRLRGPEGLNGRAVDVEREFRVQPPAGIR